MYLPRLFRQDDPGACFDLIDAHPFGLLASTQDGTPFGTHLPFWLDRGAGPHGTLYGHVARANPHQRLFSGAEALAVFTGPHAYISPTWYGAAPHVPTWNYVAVHGYGVPAPVTDAGAAVEVLRRLAARAEPGAAAPGAPWREEALPEEFRARLLREIVVFAMPLSRLEGKWKLGQNRTPTERASLLAALEARGPAEQQLAAYLRAWYAD